MLWIQNFVSTACKYFLFVTLHCTALQSCYQKLALQSCYQKLALHRAAPQIIYLNRKFLDIFSFFQKVVCSNNTHCCSHQSKPYISDSIAIGYWLLALAIQKLLA